MRSETSTADSPAWRLFLAAHASLLSQLHAQSKAARWGLSPQEFAAALYRSATHQFPGDALSGGSADAVAIYLRGLHLEDLAMARAMRLGSEPAWEEFVARYRPVLYAAARAIVTSAGEARARELADSLYADLYMAKGDGAGRGDGAGCGLLDYFHGRSKLSTWLRAVLAQRHVDALRAGQRTESLAEGDAAEIRSSAPLGSTNAAQACDPDRARLLPRLRQAVSQALAELTSVDRLLLALYYVEELTLSQIARLRGMHEATASRHLERIRRELREAVERGLAAGSPPQNGNSALPALSAAEVQLCFEYAVEDWSFDLRKSLPADLSRPPGEKN